MDVDDDAPPELVATAPVEDDEEEKRIKVPITIVTGKFPRENIPQLHLRRFLTHTRLSGSGKNYLVELHPNSPAWKEDCCHHER